MRQQAWNLRDNGSSTRGDHDGATREAMRALRRTDLDLPGAEQTCFPLDDVNAQRAIALGRIMGGNPLNSRMDMRHHQREIHRTRRIDDALCGQAPGLRNLTRRMQKRLGGYTAGVQAIAPHLVALDQGHTGTRGCSNVGSDQPSTTSANDDEIALELPWPRPASIQTAALQRIGQEAPGQRQHAEKRQRAQQTRRRHIPDLFDSGQLRTRIHVDQRRWEHGNLAHSIERGSAQWRQAHRQIDQKKRENRDQTQTKKIGRSVARDAGIDGCHGASKASSQRLAQQITRGQKGQGGADGRGE